MAGARLWPQPLVLSQGRKTPLFRALFSLVVLVLEVWENGQTMKHGLSLFRIPLILLCAAGPALVAQGGAEPLSCADRSITAIAVRTPEDVQAFVRCAYEFVQEVGFGGGPAGLSRGSALAAWPLLCLRRRNREIRGGFNPVCLPARSLPGRQRLGTSGRSFR